MTPRLWLLSVVVGVAPGLNNLGLKMNSVGFYTVVKLMVTPMIVAMEWALEGKSVSWPQIASLTAITYGVGLASVSEIELTASGALVAAVWLPVAAVYKVRIHLNWTNLSARCAWFSKASVRLNGGRDVFVFDLWS